MRRPRALWRDLGAAGFLGFQVLFLGAITSYLRCRCSGPPGWPAPGSIAIWQSVPAWLALGFAA